MTFLNSFSEQNFGQKKRAENVRNTVENDGKCEENGGTLWKFAETCRRDAEQMQKRAETCGSAMQTLAYVFWVLPEPESCFPVSRHGDFHSSPMCTKSTLQFQCVFQVELMICRSGCHGEASIYSSTVLSSSLRSFAPLWGVSNLKTLRN